MRKTILTMIVVGLVATIYTGCSSALDVDFDAGYNKNMLVDVPEESRSVGFSTEVTIDPATNENVEKYGDKIKQVSIKSVVLEIMSVSKENVGLDWGKFQIYPTGAPSNPLNASWDIPQMPIAVGGTITLGNEGNQWSNVSEMLKQLMVFDAVLEGETSEGGVKATFKLKIETKVTANPL